MGDFNAALFKKQRFSTVVDPNKRADNSRELAFKELIASKGMNIRIQSFASQTNWTHHHSSGTFSIIDNLIWKAPFTFQFQVSTQILQNFISDHKPILITVDYTSKIVNHMARYTIKLFDIFAGRLSSKIYHWLDQEWLLEMTTAVMENTPKKLLMTELDILYDQNEQQLNILWNDFFYCFQQVASKWKNNAAKYTALLAVIQQGIDSEGNFSNTNKEIKLKFSNYYEKNKATYFPTEMKEKLKRVASKHLRKVDLQGRFEFFKQINTTSSLAATKDLFKYAKRRIKNNVQLNMSNEGLSNMLTGS